jgi:ankyrin repeat protein
LDRKRKSNKQAFFLLFIFFLILLSLKKINNKKKLINIVMMRLTSSYQIVKEWGEMVKEGKADNVKHTIRHYKDIDLLDQPDIRGSYLVKQAIRQRKKEVLELLLKAGAAITEAKDPDSDIHYAVTCSTAEIVEVLLSYHLDMNGLSNGRTPLFTAVTHNKLKTTELLLNKGADAFIVCLNTTLFYEAVSYDYRAIVKLLIKKKAYATADINNPVVMKYAIKNEDLFLVKKLIELGAVLTDEHASFLHKAVKLEKEHILKHFLETQPQLDVNRRNNSGNTPLHTASDEWSCHTEMIVLLLQHGAEPNVMNNAGRTPLMSAVRDGAESTKVLLDHGADPNLHGDNARPPLHIASGYASVRVIDLLLDKGAYINAVHEGKSALGVALHNSGQKVALRLIERGADINDLYHCRSGNIDEMIHLAARRNCPDVLTLLIENGHDVNKKNADGECPLRLTTTFGYKMCAKILLDAGADIDAQDEDGNTSLFKAIRGGQSRLARYLLKRGADIYLANKKQKSPYTWYLERDKRTFMWEFIDIVHQNTKKQQSNLQVLCMQALFDIKTSIPPHIHHILSESIEKYHPHLSNGHVDYYNDYNSKYQATRKRQTAIAAKRASLIAEKKQRTQ